MDFVISSAHSKPPPCPSCP